MANILVVDDEAEIRDLIRRVLVRDGHQVDVAIHGLAALDAMRERVYDLAICNIRMPVMDGPSLYARVLEQSPRLARRFVFCTGDIVSAEVRTFLLSAGQPVLAKPFSIAGLRELVRTFLEGSCSLRPSVAHQLDECLAASFFPA